MLNKTQLPRLSLIALSVIQCSSLMASSNVDTDVAYTYRSRGTGQFLAGGNQQLGGFADGMVPLWQRPNQVFFADGTVLLGQNQRQTYSGGLGYRRLHDGNKMAGIWGVYSFVDYFHTDKSNEFWLLNPGVEWLSTDYEARLQGYFPLNGRTKTYQTARASNIPQDVANSASQMTSNFFGARGRRVFDSNVALVEQIGPGVELEVGKSLTFNQMKFGQSETNRAWFRVGGYHYNIQNHSDVYGIQANIEAPLNRHVSLIVQNNYDNQNDNRFSVGLRASFGGSDAPLNTAQSRMMDPIIRHQARQSYGEATPKRLNFVQQNEITLIDNGWFFSPNGTAPRGLATTLSDCTAENPCNTIDSETALRIQQLDPQANLLFETGSYLIPENSPRIANLWDGQSVLGRETGWFNPASGATRPIVEGGLFWGDASDPNRVNSTGYIEHMVVRNDDQIVDTLFIPDAVDPVAIAVGATGQIAALNTDTLAIRRTDASNNARAYGVYGRDLDLEGGQHVAEAYSDGADTAEAFGVSAGQDVLLNQTNTSASAYNIYDGSARASGIVADNIEVYGGNHYSEAFTVDGVARAYTVSSNFNSVLTINNAMTFANAESSGAGQIQAFGVIGFGSESEMIVKGGEHSAEGRTVDGNTNSFAGISAVLSFGDIFIENANTSARVITNGNGNVLAFGVNGLSSVYVIGGSHEAYAMSNDGSAQARGVLAFIDAIVTGASTTATAETFGDGFLTSATGIRSNNGQITVTGGTHQATANSANGFTEAFGINALNQDVFASGANTYAATNSGSGTSIAQGVLAQGRAEVIGGEHVAEAQSTSGNVVIAAGIVGTTNGVRAEQVTVSALARGLDAANVISAQGVTSNDGNLEISDSSISVESIAGPNGGAGTEAFGVLGRGGQVTANNVNTSASVSSEGTHDSNAIGIQSDQGDAIVNGGMQQAEATSESGAALASGIQANNSFNAFVTNSDTEAHTQSDSGTSIAQGVVADGRSEVTGGTHRAEAISNTGEIIVAAGLVGQTNGVQATDVNVVATASGVAADIVISAQGVVANGGDAEVYGGDIRAESSAGELTTGLAEAYGVWGNDQDVVADQVNTTAIVNSVDSGALAIGVNAINNAMVTGGTHDANATSEEGGATAIGVRAGNEAEVGNNDILTTIVATANNNNPATATATGVQATSGDVVNTDITVNGNGNNNQCAGGVMSPDGSCS